MEVHVREAKKSFVINAEIEKHLLKSEEDIKKGRIKKAEIVFKELKEKYGI